MLKYSRDECPCTIQLLKLYRTVIIMMFSTNIETNKHKSVLQCTRVYVFMEDLHFSVFIWKLFSNCLAMSIFYYLPIFDWTLISNTFFTGHCFSFFLPMLEYVKSLSLRKRFRIKCSSSWLIVRSRANLWDSQDANAAYLCQLCCNSPRGLDYLSCHLHVPAPTKTKQ